MNELTVPLDDNDRIEIGNELEKLFILQDRPINKDKKAILVEELCLTGYPKSAILAGMKSLQAEDLKSVKFVHIVDAIKDKMTYEEEQATRCDYCDSRGMVMMRNKDRYQFALACVCVNGNRFRSQGNARWNGQQFQESKRHGTLELEYSEFVLGKR
jgi:hypothetical protein